MNWRSDEGEALLLSRAGVAAWTATWAAMLSACGGGLEGAGSDQRVSATGAPAPISQRLTAAAATLDSREQRAEPIFELAERLLPQHFAGRPSTVRSDAFVFRHYPATGVYLAVMTQPVSTFAMDGVYVLGGAFGSGPVYAGQLTDFLPATAAGGNGCFDLVWLKAKGTRYSVTMNWTGQITGLLTYQTSVGERTTYSGYPAVETVMRVTGRQGSAGGSGTESDQEIKSYGLRTGDLEVTEYGSVNTDLIMPTLNGPRGITTLVYSTPIVTSLNALAPGQSVRTGGIGTATTVLNLPNGQSRTNVNPYRPEQVDTFIGIEAVTVPAGTFTTCKFETRPVGQPGLLITYWVIHGRGVEVRKISSATGQPSTMNEAVSVDLGPGPVASLRRSP